MTMFKLGDDIPFRCWYGLDGVAVTGLTVTAVLLKPDGTNSAPVVTEKGFGFYGCDIPDVDQTGIYLIRFATSAEVDQKQVPAAATVGLGGVEFLDSAISDIAEAVWEYGTRTLTSFGDLITDIAASVWGYVERTLTSGDAPSAEEIADAVWDEPVVDHVDAGSTGEKLNNISNAIGTLGVTVVSPVASNGTITLEQADDYYQDDSRALSFTFTGAPVLTDARSVLLKIGSGLSISGTVISATQLRFQPTTTQTATLNLGSYQYEVEVVLDNGHRVTLQTGTATVRRTL